MEHMKLFDAEELIALAKQDLADNRVEAALAKLKTAATHSDCHIEVAALLAKIYSQLKLFERAQQQFQRFLEEYPEATVERFQLGMITLESGDAKEALNVWQALLDDDPSHPPALYYSAVAYLELNQPQEARRLLDILLKTAPADNLYFGRGKELLTNIDRGAEGSQASSPPSEPYLSNLN